MQCIFFLKCTLCGNLERLEKAIWSESNDGYVEFKIRIEFNRFERNSKNQCFFQFLKLLWQDFNHFHIYGCAFQDFYLVSRTLQRFPIIYGLNSLRQKEKILNQLLATFAKRT